MAKKPAAATVEDLPPAMDYAQHEGTWRVFTGLVKWSIVALGLLVVALYCFIEARQPILGTLLLLVLPVGAVALFVSRSRNLS